MIISIWGNNGSGTSTLAIKLALAFAKRSKNVLLVDSNFITPQAKIWFPKHDLTPEQSLANILANNIELETTASKITMVNDYLGYLGYARDLSVNAIPSRDDTPGMLLKVVNNIADVVIVDCQSNITQDIMSFMAIDLADTKIVSMTPDLRGLSWYESNVMMLKEKWEAQGAQIIRVFNKVKINAPADAMEKAVGNIDFYMPYYEELEEELYIGALGDTKYKGRSKKYSQVIDSLVDTINEHHHIDVDAKENDEQTLPEELEDAMDDVVAETMESMPVETFGDIVPADIGTNDTPDEMQEINDLLDSYPAIQDTPDISNDPSDIIDVEIATLDNDVPSEHNEADEASEPICTDEYTDECDVSVPTEVLNAELPSYHDEDFDVVEDDSQDNDCSPDNTPEATYTPNQEIELPDVEQLIAAYQQNTNKKNNMHSDSNKEEGLLFDFGDEEE